MKRFTFLLLAFFIPSIVFSQEVLDITKLSHEDDIGNSVSIFKDESRLLNIEEISNATFIKYQKKRVNFGYNNDNDWVKFKIHNPTSDSINKILMISRLLIAETELFYQIDGKWDSIIGGNATQKSLAPIKGINIYLPFVLPPQDTTSFYLRVTDYNSKAVPMSIIDNKHVSKENSNGFTILGLIIGSIMIITLYNLFLGFSTRDSLYFHYALANLFSLIGILAVRGYHSYYIPDHLNYLVPIIATLSVGLWVVFSANFSVRILELKKYSRNSYYLLIGVAAINFLIMIIFVILKVRGDVFNYQLMTPGTLIFCLTAIICGVIALKNGSHYAKYYLSAWGCFLLGVILLTLTMLGVISYDLFTRNFYVIGSICELLIFSFALADRFNVLQKEKNRLKYKLDTTKGDLNTVISDNQIRHRFNDEILLNLDNIMNSDDDNLRRELKSYAHDIRLQTDVEEKLNYDQENIQKMDIELKKKLRASFPDLSSSEIEIFLLMRLNLSIKEIARIRNASESAVKSARHRIKKKTNLDPKEIIDLTID